MIELGAGLGFTSIALSAIGVRTICTDKIVDHIEENAKLNKLPCIKLRCLLSLVVNAKKLDVKDKWTD